MTEPVLDQLYDVIRQRQRERPQGSYVAQLLEQGVDAMGAKVREEAQELAQAALGEGRERVVSEAADLVFHAWVLLAAADVSPGDVYAELGRRFGTGGLVEKAARGGTDAEG
ncbi:MAG: phosphoribosyl-ATP diphosphatase [Proteobacteria bacterium]|nr:phosphoribosyl-ATP diphosphatase [Pseudomonadota bacterium]